mmetsp:Transcript_9041/g.20413  ORF Transcript_9041/g.20413 Transcript_9041/m.20413 type:complete len:114 (-) Transcript_9041:98-439(-)
MRSTRRQFRSLKHTLAPRMELRMKILPPRLTEVLSPLVFHRRLLARPNALPMVTTTHSPWPHLTSPTRRYILNREGVGAKLAHEHEQQTKDLSGCQNKYYTLEGDERQDRTLT